MLATMKAEVLGVTPLTVDKSGVLVDKNHSKERRDLLDGVIERLGELPPLTSPDAVTSPRKPAPPPQ
jgi:hypothetical protein